MYILLNRSYKINGSEFYNKSMLGPVVLGGKNLNPFAFSFRDKQPKKSLNIRSIPIPVTTISRALSHETHDSVTRSNRRSEELYYLPGFTNPLMSFKIVKRCLFGRNIRKPVNIRCIQLKPVLNGQISSNQFDRFPR